SKRRRIAECNDDIDLARRQFVDETRQPVDVALRPAALECQIPTKLIAALGEPTNKSGSLGAVISNGCSGAEQADAIDLRRALAEGRAGPRDSRAEPGAKVHAGPSH